MVPTTEKMLKKEVNDMEIKPNVVEEDITHPIINKTDKPQASKSKKTNPSEMNKKMFIIG